MEVAVSVERLTVVQTSTLKAIPSPALVTQAISLLCSQASSASNVYIKFPFGLLDYDGLKGLQAYHEHLQNTRRERKATAWLGECANISQSVNVDISKIKQCLQSNGPLKLLLQNLVGDCWVTEKEIDKIFAILNGKFADTVCIVYKPDQYIDEKLKLKVDRSLYTKVLLALNVGKNPDGTTFVTDGSKIGNHWTLLALDITKHTIFYGDSLGWQVPQNLMHSVKKMLQGLTNLDQYIVLPINNSNEHFYPVQSCSDMCGVILICMSAILCEIWDSWSTFNKSNAPKFLLNPSQYSRELRLKVMSWLVANAVDITGINEYNIGDSTHSSSLLNNVVTDTTEVTDSAFSDVNSVFSGVTEQCSSQSDSSDDETWKRSCESISVLRNILPSKYEYKFADITQSKGNCAFKIKLTSEEEARKWVVDYNATTQETMVFERNKKRMGNRVLRKLYLRCQHNQRQTGKHTKSDRVLKTTHKEHNMKHTNCPARMTLTVLAPHPRHNNYLIEVNLRHIHNHLTTVADALRFRPLSEDVKSRYFDLFQQGHSPSSAHLEHESNLMYSDNPQLVADRNSNPKLSDVYNLFNKWRKKNLGVRTGKELFKELEKKINVYNDEHQQQGGKAIVQRFCKNKEKGEDRPLILAICTPLMARVHEHVQQSKELIFIDSSSSFEDYNNPIFVLSTSSAAGGLPLGIVITSGESASTIHSGLSVLEGLLPKCCFYGQGSPENIMTDDSSAEREGLHRMWPSSKLYLCIFHFLQSMWRWLLCKNNDISQHDRQSLMALVKKLVYTKTEKKLTDEFQLFKNNPLVKTYKNFVAYMEQNWARRQEWAVCYRNNSTMRGIQTNNYAEAGIRILKDIVFKRIKAYNLIQVFDFITMTFEMYYERRLLAVAYNRIDRYISLRYKGLGAYKVNDNDIRKDNDCMYVVKSKTYDNVEYLVDSHEWTCTCSIGRTGHPSGEPCKHQHAVATKYKINAPNLLPYFNSKGRYLHALIALGKDKTGDEAFYANLCDNVQQPANTSIKSDECHISVEGECSHDDGEENLKIMIDIFKEQDELKEDVIDLGVAFFHDIEERIEEMDQQYLTGLKRFFTVYLETVERNEPASSSTPQLSSLLHTYFTKSSTVHVAGSRRMHVQPTAISRRRKGLTRGNQMAPSGRPPKRPCQSDCNVQQKRGRQEHTKRKQNLQLNISKNQANHFKHGHGH